MPNNKTMYDKGKIVVGLCIFVILVTFPIWYNLGKAAPAPEPKLSAKAQAAKECVEACPTAALAWRNGEEESNIVKK